MNSIDTSAVLAQMHSPVEFDTHKSRIENVENNTKETEARIEAIEENNKQVAQKIDTETTKFSQETDSQVRKTLMEQLNSPFPMLSTEVRLKAM